jgi:hypothetical protein
MKIDDVLYFAPDIPFDEVDFDGPQLPAQFAARIDGFYLEPADYCVQRNFVFAAGVLLTTCIDALARVQARDTNIERRFTSFARKWLPSFSTMATAKRLYEEFRHGLIHEARIKKGAQFSLEFAETVREFDGILVINPARLSAEVRQALDSYIEFVRTNAAARNELSATLKADHGDDR